MRKICRFAADLRRIAMSGLRFASGHVRLCTLPLQSRAFLALLASPNRNSLRVFTQISRKGAAICRDLREHRCPPVSRVSVFPSACDNSGLRIIEIARIHPFSGKPQVCGKLGALRQKCHFATRNKIILIITRAREIAIFRSATLFGNALPLAGKVKPHDFYNGVP